MIDFATLFLKTDSRGLLDGERAMDRLSRAGANTEQRVSRSMDNVKRAMSSVGTMATAFIGTLSAGLAGNFVFQAAEEYARMTNTLKAMGSTSEEAAQQLQQITDVALSTRAPLSGTAQLYSRLSVAGKELGVSQQQILKFTESVGLALGASGVGAQEASGALFQLSQAMAGGTVRAEEFNSILEGAYPLALAAARGIDEAGGSVGKLRQLVVDGKVSSKEFFDAILDQSDELRASFEETDMTVSQAFTNLGTALTSFIGQLNQSTGITSTIAKAIDIVAQNVDRLAAYLAATALAVTAYFIPAIIAGAVALGRLAAAALLTRAALIRTGIGAIIVLLGEMIYWLDKTADKLGGWGIMFSMVGDIGTEVMERLSQGANLLGETFEGMGMAISAAFQSGFASALEAFASFTGSIAGGWNSLMESMGMEGNATALGAGLAEEMRTAADKASANAAAFNDSVGNSWAELTRPLDSLQALKDALAETGDEAGLTAEQVDTMTAAVDAAGTSAENTKEKVKELTEEQKKLRQTAERLEDSFADTFTSIVMGAESAQEAVSGLLNSLAQMAINSAFKSLFAGMFDPISWLFSAKGNVFSNGNVKAFANGGVVSSPTAFPMAGSQMGLMGEAGPEAIMPLSRGANGKLGVQAEQQTIRLVVAAEEGEMFVPRVRSISGNVALQVSSRVAQAQQSSFGSTIDNYDQRGTT